MSTPLKLIFTFSIMLNVILIGAHAGMLLKRQAAHSEPRVKAMEHVSAQTQEKVRMAMDKTRKELKPQKEQIDAIRSQIEIILDSESFNRAAYLDAVSRMHDAVGGLVLKKSESIVDILAELPAEERAAVAKKLMRPMRMGNKKGRKGHKAQGAEQRPPNHERRGAHRQNRNMSQKKQLNQLEQLIEDNPANSAP